MQDVIIVIGFSNSGKSTLAKYLNQMYNYSVFEISRYVMEEFIKQTEFSMPLDFCDNCFKHKSLIQFTEKMLYDSLGNEQEYKKVFVGARMPEEIEAIKNTYPQSFTIGILSDIKNREIRFQISKKEKAANRDLNERNKVESQWGLNEELIRQCDAVIYNNDTLENFYSQIDIAISKEKRGRNIYEKWKQKFVDF